LRSPLAQAVLSAYKAIDDGAAGIVSLRILFVDKASTAGEKVYEPHVQEIEPDLIVPN